MEEQVFVSSPGLVESIRKHARLAVITGVLLVICGALAIASPLAAGVWLTLFVGVLLAIAGVAQCVLAFRAGAFGKGILLFVVGALTALAGLFLCTRPIAGLASITLFLAAYFLVAGAFEIAGALQSRPAHGWGWLLATGVITLLLGWLIWQQFPLSGIWAVGVLFGVRLVLGGWTLIFIGRNVRHLAQEAMA